MPAYHAISSETYYQSACGFPLVPIKTSKTPILDFKTIKLQDGTTDIIDEALSYFRANILFKNFSLKNEADKVIVYTTVFISKCIEVIYQHYKDPKKSKELLTALITEAEWSSTLTSHFLNTILVIKSNEVVDLQKYLKQIRTEVVYRLNYIFFEQEGASLDIKYWIGYAKKKFLGYDMPVVKKYK